ncbi:hypothetical protein LEP1GSC059_4667 [Leptospira noguchii serovar Panama str. CZ214]|uniref:Uncharacterized protein n=1 Tax=Leptospira noguchii serovar Panama str. CZ214 TaxID=1001595 RepID=T0GP74_9LEPT|nr:hypothetical protein LEP1GSC059_4667 [Leptospira noguchii serovar Panama str. CZ214]
MQSKNFDLILIYALIRISIYHGENTILRKLIDKQDAIFSPEQAIATMQ